ncbi:DUF4192 domain-containing protein [Arthrobacter sp. CAN_A1]|uniref:DUF4192 domain-containing protein n=1 Tax=Arthrobacter sp. CAN_A1 TaxID=2787717 RepID=UPI0018C922C0
MTPLTTPSEQPYQVTSAADILSYVLHTLGFQPAESLVLLTMCGKRVGATLRVDLPANDLDPAEYAAGVCSILASDTSADGALLVLYSTDVWALAAGPPRQDLVSCLSSSLHSVGLELRDGWLVTDTVWRDYFCTDPDCCPWPGYPLESVTDSPLHTELVFRGSSIAQSLTAAVHGDTPQPWADPAQMARRWQDQQDRLGWRWTAAPQFATTLALWDVLLTPPADPGPLDDHDITAHLLASLSSRPLRDAVLVSAALGRETAVSGAAGNGVQRPGRDAPDLPPGGWAVLDLDPGAAAHCPRDTADRRYAREFCDVLIGQHRGQLRWDRVDVAHELFSRLSAVATDEPRVALLTMLGWIEWARGRGSRAHLYLQEALKEMPNYSLAGLLDQVVARGILAEWTRDRELAWRHGTPHAV